MRILINLNKSVKLEVFLFSALFWFLPQNLFAGDPVLNQVLSSLEKGTQLEAFVPCVLEKYSDAVCVVIDRVVTEGDSRFHKRSLLIYDVKREGLKKVFQYDQEEYSGLLSIRWMNTSSIMAIWATGSATVVTLFRVIDKDIKLVLEVGTKFSPEVIDLDGDGINEVLISEGSWIAGKDGKRVFKPTKTSIYRFQKDKYIETKAVPFENRFIALQRK
jgi:hypothetical protein